MNKDNPPKTIRDYLDELFTYAHNRAVKGDSFDLTLVAISNTEKNIKELIRSALPEKKVKSSEGYPNAEKLEAWKDGYNKALSDFKEDLKAKGLL